MIKYVDRDAESFKAGFFGALGVMAAIVTVNVLLAIAVVLFIHYAIGH